jgi:hypothetical protein
MPPPLEQRAVYSSKRPPARRLALIGGGVIVVAAAAAVAVSALGGSTSRKPGGSASASTQTTTAAKHARSHAHRPAHKPAPKPTTIPPAETSVTVLNATEANGLAHRTAIELQQGGYSQAQAQSGTPPGSSQVSVVEYSTGHQPEAENVAHSLGIGHVLPVEAGVTALAGAASVVVIVGQDRVSKSQ